MKYLAFIQARCGSTRLPNKVLMDLCGKPALLRTIERVKRSKLVDEVVVVTSIERCNLPILKLCAENDVRVFVGSEHDVLDRYYQAAKLFNSEYIVRITGDCPCFDGDLLDEALHVLGPETDYLGMISETFADGLDIEVFKFSALKTAWKEASLQSEREHVTQYFIKHPELFVQQDFVSPVGNFGEKRWTLDEAEDYNLLKNIYQHFNATGHMEFTYKDILNYLKSNPQLETINAKFARNEGLKKSIQTDCCVANKEEG